MNIKFIPSKFFFVCCKASSVPIKTKWYCQEEGFLYSPHGWLDLLISVTPGVIAVRWRDDNSHRNIFIISFDIIMAVFILETHNPSRRIMRLSCYPSSVKTGRTI